MTIGTLPIQGRIRSEMLGELRKIDGLKKLLGTLAQFVIVVDANVILGDLIWLVSKRKKPDAVTELMECIWAGTIVAYIARSVLAEVDEHITTIAADKKLSEDALRQEWKKYRKLVKVRKPREAMVDRYRDGQDPDDAPTIALEKILRADGILSKDTDIAAMGGLVIEMDFTNRAREYSRKTAVAATIRLSGGMAILVSGSALALIWKSIQGATVWLKRLPVPVQLILFVAVVAVAADRRARQRVTAMLVQMNESVSCYWPDVLSLLANLGTELAENTVPPPVPTFSTPKKRAIGLRRDS
jgi:predicted nucleic acid-binding protein